MDGPEERDRMVEAEAAAWVVRLEAGPLTAAERQALDAWLRRSERHAAAFAFARETWSDLGHLRTAASPAPGAQRSGRVLHARPVLRRRLLQGLAASFVVAAGVGMVAHGGGPLTLDADYRTSVGESLSVTLPDGSTARLNTDTAIDLRFDESRREVELLAGEAAFTVARAPGRDRRPFIVRAGGGTARALGTRFLVRRQEAGVEVTVLEHRVEVSAGEAGAGSPRAVILGAAESVRYDGATGLGPARQVDPDRAAAWLRGRLVFDRVPLAHAVAEVNRYRRGRIIVMNPALAHRSVSGVFRLDALDAAVDIIATELGARHVTALSLVTVLY